MNRSDLIERLVASSMQLSHQDAKVAVRTVLEHMTEALALGQRFELRGYGSFSLHYHPPRQARNPRTGEAVALPGRYLPHFKPGKALCERVNGTGKRANHDRAFVRPRPHTG